MVSLKISLTSTSYDSFMGVTLHTCSVQKCEESGQDYLIFTFNYSLLSQLLYKNMSVEDLKQAWVLPLLFNAYQGANYPGGGTSVQTRRECSFYLWGAKKPFWWPLRVFSLQRSTEGTSGYVLSQTWQEIRYFRTATGNSKGGREGSKDEIFKGKCKLNGNFQSDRDSNIKTPKWEGYIMDIFWINTLHLLFCKTVRSSKSLALFCHFFATLCA